MGKKNKSKNKKKGGKSSASKGDSKRFAEQQQKISGEDAPQYMQLDEEEHNKVANDAEAKIEIVEEDDDGMVIDVQMDEDGGEDEEGDDDNEEMQDRDDAGSIDESEDESGSESGAAQKQKKSSEKKNASAPMPFMDTFYSLSSESSNERTVAAHCLIRHCFPTSADIQAKDAAYALRRLMTGLCSGRAGARQGYASALASFLKVAFATKVDFEDEDGGEILAIRLIQKDLAGGSSKDDDGDDDEAMPEEEEDEDNAHSAEFVRKLLIEQTTPSQPSKRGSEERDYIFGRLFGIMAVVRSGTLSERDVPVSVVEEYANNLVTLYKHKKWMREPAAHGIMELLTSLQMSGSGNDSDAVTAVVKDSIVPSLILDGAKGDASSWSNLTQSMTAEQIGLCLHIQTLSAAASSYDKKLPEPLNSPLLTPELMPSMSNALRSTSDILYPRSHLIWNAIWMYLSESNASEGKRKKGGSKTSSPSSSKRALRRALPVGDATGNDVVKSIVSEIISKSLLGIDGSGNTTHERRTLALNLVQALCGASSPRLCLPPSLIESEVLQPSIVERVFINTIQTTPGGRDSRAEHTLKPLALQVLVSIVDAVVSDSADEDNIKLRLALAKSFASAEPRFDAITKTDTITSLLLADVTEDPNDLLSAYMIFLESMIFSSAPHEAVGYIYSMLALGKRAIRIPAPGDDDGTSALVMAKNVLGFFLAGSSFDLSGFSEPKSKRNEKKQKDEESHPATSAARRIIASTEGDGMSLPYQLRSTMSSSFFSYLADVLSIAPSSSTSSEGGISKGDKAQSIHELITFITQECDVLEQNGAAPYSSAKESAAPEDDEEDAPTPPKEALKAMRTLVQSISSDDQSASSVATSCSSLLSALYLQLLSPGRPDGDSEDEDVMDEDQEDADEMLEEVKEMMSDVLDITNTLLGEDKDDGEPSEVVDDEEEEKPLAAFAELYVNILSSSVGSDVGKNVSRGGATKLLRDCVKNAWSLSLAYAQDKNLAFDQDVMAILVESVCGPSAMRDEVEGDDGEEEDEDADMSSGDEDSDDQGVFVAANVADLNLNDSGDEDENDDDAENDKHDDDSERSSQDESDEEDVELDQEQLNNLLLEDSDVEGGADVLEHHAGADKALAKLIKMKQDARKAGQAALERIEIANRMRCLVLLETALSSNSALEDSAILMAILPLLRAIRSIDKAIEHTSGPKKNAGLSEKKALMDRMSSLLKKKMCKTRLNGISSLEGEKLDAARDARADLAARVMDEARRSRSKSHSDCCSLSLVLIMKSLPQDEDNAVAVAKKFYCDALKQWSSAKSSKLKVSMFNELIVRSPSLARAVLAEPLVESSSDSNARPPFLKAEAFLLLSDLYHIARSDESPLADAGLTSLKDAAGSVASSLSSASQDSDLVKVKRARNVLKAATELVAFSSAHCKADGDLWDQLQELSRLLKAMGEVSSSQAVEMICDSIIKKIAEGLESRGGAVSEKKASKSAKKGKKK